MNECEKYSKLHSQGAKPHDIYLTGKADGLDLIGLLRMLRKVCDLSLSEAKEVTLVADGLAANLSEHEARIAEMMEDEPVSLESPSS